MKMYISDKLEDVEKLNNRIHYNLFIGSKRYLANRYSPIFYNEESIEYGIVIVLDDDIKNILTEEEQQQLQIIDISKWNVWE